MATKISDTVSGAVYRQTDEPIKDVGRPLCVGIIRGDKIILRPVGLRNAKHIKRIPIESIWKNADMLASDAGAAPKLTATTSVELRDGSASGRVVVTLEHSDILTFRLQGSQTTFALSIEQAYREAAKRHADREKQEKALQKRLAKKG